MLPETEPKESFEGDERTALTESKAEIQEPISAPHAPRRAYRITKILMQSFVVLLAIYGSVAVTMDANRFVRQHLERKYRSSNEVCDCGKSIEEAQAMGCTYSQMAAAWLPPHCRDEELEEDFNHAGPGEDGAWSYWHDQNATHPLALEEIGMLAGTDTRYWSTARWHISHCVYYWLKGYRLAKTGVILEPRYDGEFHMRHCMIVFLSGRTDLEFVTTFQGAALTSGLDPTAME